MPRRAAWTGTLICGLVAFFLIGCTTAADPWKGETAPVRVVVTIPPLASMVKGIGKDRVAVRSICTNKGPHGFAADTRQALLLHRAKILFAVGLQLDDSFADKLYALSQRSDLRYIKLGHRISPKLLEELKHSHEPGEKHDHKHKHGKFDPHLWLGLPEAIEMVKIISTELQDADSDHKETYAKNALAYIAKLENVYNEGKAALVKHKNARLVSFHESLSYFARSFDLEIATVIQEGPGDEPTSARMKMLVDTCSNPKAAIRAIAVEPQFPKSTSATILQQELKKKKVEVPLVEIDPLETADGKELDKEGADWFPNRMRKNLDALGKVLSQ